MAMELEPPQHRRDDTLARGIARFNETRFFEAHEAWEDCWRGKEGAERHTVQALIQVAVAMHHQATGNIEGAASVMKRAWLSLQDSPDDFRGIDLARLRRDVSEAIQELLKKRKATLFRIRSSGNP